MGIYLYPLQISVHASLDAHNLVVHVLNTCTIYTDVFLALLSAIQLNYDHALQPKKSHYDN